MKVVIGWTYLINRYPLPFNITGLTHNLPMLKEEQVFNGTGMKILSSILDRPFAIVTHLEHFIFKMHPNVPSSKFPVSFCKFAKKGITNEATLTRLLQIGIKILSKDIKDLINILPEDEGVAVLTFALSKCSASAPDITSAATAAVTCKKFTFLSTLIVYGATPSISNIIECINWTSLDPNILNYVITKGTPKEIAHFVIKAIRADEKKFDGTKDLDTKLSTVAIDRLLNDLHQYKCLVCCKEVIAEILKSDVFGIHIIKLLCLLLNYGANSIDLCQARFEKATPLHVATELALESGICLCVPHHMLVFTVSFVICRKHRHYFCCYQMW